MVKMDSGKAGPGPGAPGMAQAIARATQEPAGYPIDPDTGEINRDDSIISWDNPSRTLSINPIGDSFDYFIGGIRHVSRGTSAQIPDTEGLWFFYFDKDGFQVTQNFDFVIIYNNAFTAFIYWDALNDTVIGPFDERHGTKLDGHAHGWLHEKFGTRHESGGALNNVITEASGDLDTSAQFGIDTGVFYDEDIKFELDAILSTVGLPVLYLEGVTPDLRIQTNAGFSILTGGAGRMVYNQNNGGTWQLTEIASNDYGLCHIFLSSGTGSDKKGRAFAVVGQADFINIVNARAAAPLEIKTLLTILPVQEKDWIATLIFQTLDSYTNGVKSRLRDTGSVENPDWLDWRVYDYKDFNKAINT